MRISHNLEVISISVVSLKLYIKRCFNAPLFILLTIILTGCGNSEFKQVERTEIAMDTVITLKAEGFDAQIAIDESFKRIYELEGIINSDLNKIEFNAGEDFVQVSPEVYEILRTAQSYAAMTDGAFDVTTGAAIELWHVGRDNMHIPTQVEIDHIKNFVGYNHLHLRDLDHSVRLDISGMKIDVGGIAKGYSVDEVHRIFNKYNVVDGLIDFGTSTIFAIGHKKIGIKNPRNDDDIIDVIEIDDGAISTSGDYIKFSIVDGRRYNHIINPQTCAPVESNIASVSVIIDGNIEHCGMIADILSTAAFVTGNEIPLPQGDCRYIFITSENM